MGTERRTRKTPTQEIETLRQENQLLRDQLAESQELVRAIREGQVDALVVSGKEGERIYTLQGAEQPYRVLIEQMSEGAVTLVQDGTISYANRSFAEMLGRPLEQLIGTAVKDYVAEVDRALFDRLMQDCSAGGGSAHGELSVMASDGRLVPAYMGLNMLLVGDLSSICVVITDLTEQKRSAEIMASERFARAILNQATDGIVVCDVRGQVTFVNAMARRLGQLQDGELRIGAELWGHAQDVTGHPLARKHWPLTQALHGQSSVAREIRMVHGEIVHDLLVNANPLRDADGKIIGAVATFTDITQSKASAQALLEQNQQLQAATEELRATEEELRSQNDQMVVAQAELLSERHRYASLFEFAPDAYLSTDSEGIIQEANRAAQKLLNTSAKSLIGTPLALYVTEDARDGFEASLAALPKNGKRLEGEWTFRPRRGPAFPAAVSIAAIAARSGRGEGAGGLRWLIRDITEQKKVAEAMEAARQAAEDSKADAERATRAKDHFLAVLSHELRTPLTPVLATVSMLQERKGMGPQIRGQLEMIRRNVELEARLIDDLLDVTRIVRGKVELSKRPLQLCTVLQQAVEVCQPDIEARKLEFGVDLGPEYPYYIDGDPARLQQVFWNLLKNAIKFTPDGGCVGIRCRLDGEGYVVAEVSDSGAGIEASVLPRLFAPFEQGERSTTRQFGGLGLGLTISKAMVEMHGGTIGARSAGKGKGATFSVRLPLIAAKLYVERTNPKPARAEAGRQKLAILLVEDHGDTAKVMKQLLIQQGHTVEHAGDVASALKLAAERSFDVLLSDLGLPDGSGLDLMRALRARGQNLPGIALSGYGQDEDVRKSKEAGFSDHLTKPVDFQRMAVVVGQIVPER